MSLSEAVAVPPALHGLRIAVLVSGGIAAYKVADLVSRLAQVGCQVRVAMTPAATRFVGPTTFHGLSGHPVQTDLFALDGHPEPHVELGDWAQVALVAPATADVLARLNAGRANDMVTATVLAARCPVVIAPAMNDAMWAKPAVKATVERLRERGVMVVEPESGHLASGHVGAGRLPRPAALLAAMARACGRQDLAGRRVVVSAGGTREPIDPVRFVSNYSSGKMGHAMAAAAAERGAQVTLVTTVSHLPEHPDVRARHVETAEEMRRALEEELPGSQLLVMAAAVADFRPAHRVEHKIRREQTGDLVLDLAPNADLVAELGHVAGTEDTFRLGFAAEDSEFVTRAEEKLERKGLDAIFANDVSRSDIGFGADDNAGMLLMRDGTRQAYERMSKRELADRLLDAVAPRLK